MCLTFDLRLRCVNCVVGHVKREANMFTYNLAKLSLDDDDVVFWWKDIPPSFCNPDMV